MFSRVISDPIFSKIYNSPPTPSTFCLRLSVIRKRHYVFLNKAIGANVKPGLINIDKSGANNAGIADYNIETNTRIKIRQCKYRNNIVGL